MGVCRVPPPEIPAPLPFSSPAALVDHSHLDEEGELHAETKLIKLSEADKTNSVVGEVVNTLTSCLSWKSEEGVDSDDVLVIHLSLSPALSHHTPYLTGQRRCLC